MKKTLEGLLAEAKPVPEKENLDKILAIYMGPEAGAVREMNKLLTAGPCTVKNHRPRWSTLAPMMGIIYRLEVDGYEPLVHLGITGEDRGAFMLAMGMLKSKLEQYGEAGQAGETQQLYDQIRAVSI